MEQKQKSNFNLFMAQKKGTAAVGGTTNKIVGILIAVLLVSVLAGTIFSYLGEGADGLGNATTNPDAPTWLAPVLIVVVGVALLYLIIKAAGITN